MKRTWWKQLYMIWMFLCVLCIGGISFPVQAAKVQLNKKQVTLWVGESTRLKLKNNRKKINWVSNNKAIVTVSKKGKLKARQEGKTTVIAKVAGKKYRCKCTVYLTKISDENMQLQYGESRTISLVNPKGEVAWFSGDTRIAYVENNVLYAKGVGTTVITAKCNGKEYYCNVTITSNETSEFRIDGIYTSRDKVALYIHTYGKLPDNFITKEQAQLLGWRGGSLNSYAQGKCIGGNIYNNYERTLPTEKDRIYYECDINTLGALERGAERIVYSNDGLIFYTSDHYATFQQLY